MSEVISAKGQNGQLSFDGQFVTITRKGFLGVTTQGKGEKRIPVGQISAVQFKPAALVTQGFIQFTIPGGAEVKSRFGSQSQQAFQDENSVVFLHKSNADMQTIRDAVEQAIIKRSEPQIIVSPPSASDELTRLAGLHAQGVLSDAEFAAAKARLLGL